MARTVGDCGLQWGCLWPVCHPECRANLPGRVKMLPKGHRDVTAPTGTTAHMAIPEQNPGTEGRALA